MFHSTSNEHDQNGTQHLLFQICSFVPRLCKWPHIYLTPHQKPKSYFGFLLSYPKYSTVEILLSPKFAHCLSSPSCHCRGLSVLAQSRPVIAKTSQLVSLPQVKPPFPYSYQTIFCTTTRIIFYISNLSMLFPCYKFLIGPLWPSG